MYVCIKMLSLSIKGKVFYTVENTVNRPWEKINKPVRK